MRNQITHQSICAWAYTKKGVKERQREVEFPELPRAFQTNKYARKEKKRKEAIIESSLAAPPITRHAGSHQHSSVGLVLQGTDETA